MHGGVSNHQPHHCLLNRLFRCRSKKTSKPRVTGLCAGNSPGTGEFPAQMASYAENVSIWWRHHALTERWCLSHVLQGSSWSVTKIIWENVFILTNAWASRALLRYTFAFWGECVSLTLSRMIQSFCYCDNNTTECNIGAESMSLPWHNRCLLSMMSLSITMFFSM